MIAVDAKRQWQCLVILRRTKNDPLTRTEFGKRLGITKVSAHLLLKKLEAQGLVSFVPSTHRNVRLTAKSEYVDKTFFSRTSLAIRKELS